jgi:hypothetical protein
MRLSQKNALGFNFFLYEYLDMNETEQEVYVCFPINNPIYAEFLTNVWIWIDMCIFFLVPFLVMSICSTVILIKINRKTAKFFKNLMNKNNASNRAACSRRAKRNRQLLYMLLLTNLYFLLSCLPYSITFMMFKSERIMSEFGKSLVHMVLYTNNAVNFLFYGFSCERYRAEFIKLFTGNRYRPAAS